LKTRKKTGYKHLSEISVPDGVLTFPQTASDEELLDGVKMWVDMLAEERFPEAYQLTAHDSHYAWTPDLIRSVVVGYGLPHESGNHEYRISKICEARGGPSPRWEVDRWQDTEPRYRVGFISFDLPLDGEWSDLTATFEIVVHHGQLILVLQDIHVF
jgi:hypothetical protein